MTVDAAKSRRTAAYLLSLVALLGFAAVGCSDIHPEPNIEEGGLLESPVHENQQVIQREEQQHENQMR